METRCSKKKLQDSDDDSNLWPFGKASRLCESSRRMYGQASTGMYLGLHQKKTPNLPGYEMSSLPSCISILEARVHHNSSTLFHSWCRSNIPGRDSMPSFVQTLFPASRILQSLSSRVRSLPDRFHLPHRYSPRPISWFKSGDVHTCLNS